MGKRISQLSTIPTSAADEYQFLIADTYNGRNSAKRMFIADLPYAQLNNISGNHLWGASKRNLWRGMELSTSSSDLSTALSTIASGEFRNLYIGDFWVHSSSGTRFRIVDIDYFYGIYGCTKHHVVVMPDIAPDSSALFNATITDISSYGYAGCMFVKQNTYLTDLTYTRALSLFGSSHMPTWSEDLMTGFYWDGSSLTHSRYTMHLAHPSQVQIFGNRIIDAGQTSSNINHNVYTYAQCQQFAAFRLHPYLSRIGEQYYWTRDPVTTTTFVTVCSNGGVSPRVISAGGIYNRPYFLVG